MSLHRALNGELSESLSWLVIGNKTNCCSRSTPNGGAGKDWAADAGSSQPSEGGRHVRTKKRKGNVKVHGEVVRKVSTKYPARPALFSFNLTSPAEYCAVADSMRSLR